MFLLRHLPFLYPLHLFSCDFVLSNLTDIKCMHHNNDHIKSPIQWVSVSLLDTIKHCHKSHLDPSHSRVTGSNSKYWEYLELIYISTQHPITMDHLSISLYLPFLVIAHKHSHIIIGLSSVPSFLIMFLGSSIWLNNTETFSFLLSHMSIVCG